jgi:hypothetical protein
MIHREIGSGILLTLLCIRYPEVAGNELRQKRVEQGDEGTGFERLTRPWILPLRSDTGSWILAL